MLNNIIVQYSIVFIIIYLFASIPWGLILGKINKIDIREHGSKNIGATNVNRVLGKKWALICFALDFLKGFLPVFIVKQLLENNILDKNATYAIVIAAFAAFAGHVWTVYLKFKGGKGIATIAGIIIALSPLSFLISISIWSIIFYSTRYVSLASIIASIAVPTTAFLLNKFTKYKLENSSLILLAILGLLAIIKHRVNILRLLKGTENRFNKK